METPITAVLLAALRPRLDDKARAWLDEAIAHAGDDLALLQAYTGASRRVGATALAPGEAGRLAARDAIPALHLEHWTSDDAARALLLLARACRSDGGKDFTAAAIACYEQGDAGEQQSWLRALPVLPVPERFLSCAIDACRTNILPLFESIACENPYPERYFPELNFNQMVLKALFNNIALTRVVGLQARLNPDMSRMAADYAAERRAAGRAVPADIAMAMIPQQAALEPR